MKNKKGSSLIEVIIALAILMIISNMLSMVFSFTTKSYGNLKKYNERLDVVEYLSKNMLHNCSYEDVKKFMDIDLNNYELVLDSDVVSNDIYNLSIEEMVIKYNSNRVGDVKVKFALNDINNEMVIVISSNTYGNAHKKYEIIKRSYGN